MSRLETLRTKHPDVPVTGESVCVSADALADAEERVERESNAAVGTVVRDPADRVLLVSNAWSDGWIVPGGLARADESLPTAARREVREETGVDVAIDRPIEFRRQRLRSTAATQEVTMWFVGFVGRVESPQPAAADDHSVDEAIDDEAIDRETIDAEMVDDEVIDDEAIDRVAWFDTVPEGCADRTLLELADVLD